MMIKTGVALLLLYAVVLLAVWLGQRQLIYVPNPARVRPADAGLPQAIEREFQTPDGERIVTWRIAARDSQPTLLYFHGNAGGLQNRAPRAARYAARGYGLLMMSYRGYSGSTGRPSEVRNVADAMLAYELLRSDGVAPRDIVLYGESLGSGVAVQIAAAQQVGAVILDAPYTSIVEMGVRRFPFLPVRALIADRYESVDHISRVKAPVMVLHGELDRVIPVAMGRALHAAANEPKRLILYPGGGHTDLDEHGAVEAVARFIGEARRH